jgi:hypothetical protein
LKWKRIKTKASKKEELVDAYIQAPKPDKPTSRKFRGCLNRNKEFYMLGQCFQYWWHVSKPCRSVNPLYKLTSFLECNILYGCLQSYPSNVFVGPLFVSLANNKYPKSSYLQCHHEHKKPTMGCPPANTHSTASTHTNSRAQPENP